MAEVYPDGIHGAITEGLEASGRETRTATRQHDEAVVTSAGIAERAHSVRESTRSKWIPCSG